MTFPVFEEQRFFKFRLNELFDIDSIVVQEYVNGLISAKQIADVIIIDISYPFHLGQPDDTHLFNAFHGNQKWCKRVDLDYWQQAKETLTIRVGDCEDSSVAFVVCARALGLKKNEVYELFGVVKDANTNAILGGHGWAVYKDGKVWRLVESTLDSPPEEYPPLDDIYSPFRLGNVIYEPEWIFNDSEFYAVKKISWREIPLARKRKETREKYEVLAAAHMANVKPLKEMDKSVLHKIRRKIKK